jgi:hypothetical protein
MRSQRTRMHWIWIPGTSLALVGRADAYESLGQLPEALADYSQALALDSGHASVLASRAVVYYALEARAG